MKIHHLNCGCMCPPLRALMPWALPKTFCTHCLLIETSDRLILVDAGVGALDCAQPSRLGANPKLLGFKLRPEETALHQLTALGYSARDLSDIVLTHLDFDHASGICDFPQAQVHVAAASLEDALSGRSLQHKLRYRPHYLQERARWSLIDSARGEAWMGLDGAQESPLSPEILFVSLPGHTPSATSASR